MGYLSTTVFSDVKIATHKRLLDITSWELQEISLLTNRAGNSLMHDMLERYKTDMALGSSEFDACTIFLWKEPNRIVAWAYLDRKNLTSFGIFVKSTHRRHGIGKRLVNQAAAFALKEKVQAMYCVHDHRSKKFYDACAPQEWHCDDVRRKSDNVE